MLSDAFIDWWFAPWRYAVPAHAPSADLLAQRDRYGDWCKEADVQAAMPATFDPGWQVAAVAAAGELRRAAELFGGLAAARMQDRQVLGGLAIADRRWCMGVALTQPMKGCGEIPFHDNDRAEVRGLAELARRLGYGFPGAWTRLRLMLPGPLAARVDTLLTAAPPAATPTAAAEARIQHLWQMCRARA
jgi:hypothetical protein